MKYLGKEGVAMYCLKCGKERRENQVFCDSCLESMEQEPVDIRTPVVIPAQPPKQTLAHRRPVINQEEEIKRLHKFNQNLMLVLVLLLTLVIVLAVMVYEKEFWQVVDNLGRNYSVIESTASTLAP